MIPEIATLLYVLAMFALALAMRNVRLVRRWSRHAEAEVLSGVGVLVLCAGMMLHMLKSGDIVSAAVMGIGCAIAIVYGILHLFARAAEKKGTG
jgi:hypothetical protein